MLYNITVKREFTGGNLKGVVIDSYLLKGFPFIGKIGHSYDIKAPIAGSPYRDTITAIEQA